MALCRAFSCPPSQLMREDAGILKWAAIAARAGDDAGVDMGI